MRAMDIDRSAAYIGTVMNVLTPFSIAFPRVLMVSKKELRRVRV